MKANDFKTAKTMEQLVSEAPPGSSILALLYGETAEESQGEIVTVMGYDTVDNVIYLTSPSMLYRSMEVPFAPDRFATSRWIDLTNADFTGLIGDHFKTLAKFVDSSAKA